MNLRELVEKYVHAAGGYGKSVPISSLDLSHEETERIFDMLDEDYHISRFFHFTNISGATAYSINEFPQTHVSIDAAISEIL